MGKYSYSIWLFYKCKNYYSVDVSIYYLQLPAGKSMLFLGMDNGVILFLVFSTPLKGLFETPFKKTSGSHQVYLQVRTAMTFLPPPPLSLLTSVLCFVHVCKI